MDKKLITASSSELMEQAAETASLDFMSTILVKGMEKVGEQLSYAIMAQPIHSMD